METTNPKLSLDNNAETISKAFGYDTMKEMQKAFEDGTMGEDKEFAFKLIVAVDSLPEGASALIMVLLESIYGEDIVYNKSSMAETLANGITDKDARNKIEMIAMMATMKSHIDGMKSGAGLGGLGDLGSMLDGLKGMMK